MPPLTETQAQHIDGIVEKIDMLLDKRFAQARRIQPKVQQAEADMRFHQIQVLRDVIGSQKGFGPIKLNVADILASADEAKKTALFSPVDQVSILNEIIPQEDQNPGSSTAGRLKVRTVSGFYSALDPSLHSILELLQTWIWWDLPDAAELYRFDIQEKSLKELQSGKDLTEADLDYYRQEMGLKAGTELTRQEIIKFELQRAKAIVDKIAARLSAEEGHQVIVVSRGREVGYAADKAIIRLGKRLQTIEAVKAQGEALDQKIRQHYAQVFNTPPEEVTAERILQQEERQAEMERERVAELLSSGFTMHDAANYKEILYGKIRQRFENICTSLGVKVQNRQAEAETTQSPQA